VTKWTFPSSPPSDIDLTTVEYAELLTVLRRLAASGRLPQQDCTQAELEADGYSCWLEHLMYRFALITDRYGG
jgi:hypothetical protein